MKKQNRASQKNVRTAENVAQQKQSQPKQLGCVTVIAHPEMQAMIDLSKRPDAVSSSPEQPESKSRDETCPTCGNRKPAAEKNKEKRKGAAGVLVTVKTTKAQQIQLVKLNGQIRSYGRFLRVATHQQMMKLRLTFPMYWEGVYRHSRFVPLQLVFGFVKKQDGTWCWPYFHMLRATKALRHEMKSRGIDEIAALK
jgi:hypothetical protein